MTTKEEEIDLTGITRNDGTPTLTSITKAKREIGRQLQNKVCANPDSKEHGQSYLIYKDAEWLKKKGVTDLVTPPTNPGTYGGTTHNALEVHRAAVLAWKRYKEAQSVTKTMIMYAFKAHHFLELEDDNGVSLDSLQSNYSNICWTHMSNRKMWQTKSHFSTRTWNKSTIRQCRGSTSVL